jgi:hypothetical protein
MKLYDTVKVVFVHNICTYPSGGVLAFGVSPQSGWVLLCSVSSGLCQCQDPCSGWDFRHWRSPVGTWPVFFGGCISVRRSRVTMLECPLCP